MTRKYRLKFTRITEIKREAGDNEKTERDGDDSRGEDGAAAEEDEGDGDELREAIAQFMSWVSTGVTVDRAVGEATEAAAAAALGCTPFTEQTTTCSVEMKSIEIPLQP